MEQFDFNQIMQNYMLGFFRISSMFMAMPFLGAQLVPVRVRLYFGILVTILAVPLMPKHAPIDPMSITGAIVIGQQIIIGISIGLVFQFVFQVVVLGGQIVAMQSGLGFATLVDPQNHDNLPMISHFYLMSVTLLFLSLNGHIMLIQVIVNSFNIIPIGMHGLTDPQISDLVKFGGEMFAGAVSIALPAIISLLVVNMTFAVMTKAAPQLNIFSIGFPLTLLLGLSVMYISFSGMMNHSEYVINQGFSLIGTLMKGQ